MTTYVYETIPKTEDEKPEFFEVQQSMRVAPLTKHPATGQPVRRVIIGGYGLLTKNSAPPPSNCGPGCCCG